MVYRGHSLIRDDAQTATKSDIPAHNQKTKSHNKKQPSTTNSYGKKMKRRWKGIGKDMEERARCRHPSTAPAAAAVSAALGLGETRVFAGAACGFHTLHTRAHTRSQPFEGCRVPQTWCSLWFPFRPVGGTLKTYLLQFVCLHKETRKMTKGDA